MFIGKVKKYGIGWCIPHRMEADNTKGGRLCLPYYYWPPIFLDDAASLACVGNLKLQVPFTLQNWHISKHHETGCDVPMF